MNARTVLTTRSLRRVPKTAAVICLMAACCWRSFGQTNSAARPAGSQRYLLILEASRSMQRRLDNAVQVGLALVRSGVNNEMRAGDTLGIWTYNETLYAGKFPLARWSPETRARLAGQVGTFFRQQKFEKQGDLRPVMKALDNLSHGSEHLTIILISTGEEDFSGADFADRINETYKSWRDEQQRAHMPMVTILRARRGEVAG